MAIKINGNTVIADNQAFTTTSTISATGNITGGNLSVIGTITAAGINTGSSPISTTGNVVGGNILTGGTVSATGNITGGNVSATNLTGTLLTAAQTNITSVGTLTSLNSGVISSSGNVTGGNLLINGSAVITGNLNVQGTETIFNVANLTVNDLDIIVANNVTGGANINGAGLQAGNPATATWFFHNATTSWQSNIAITPTANGTLSLGGASNYWGNAFLTTATVTGNVQGGNLRTAGLISATGAVTGSQFNGSGAGLTSIPNSALTNSAVTVNGTSISLGGSGTITATATGTLTIGSGLGGTSYNGSTGVTITNTGVLSLANGGGITASVSTGAVTLGSTATSANTAGAIVARGASGEFSAGVITGTATNARYADLAEKYTADAEYAPGTVLVFGGSAEVTVDAVDADRRVAGVVSTNPGFLMNEGLDTEFAVAIALTGRVPCMVIGPVRKGDLMVAAGLGRARAEADPRVGTVIGKALEDHNGESGTIEVVVGRF
jgi:hypothetical protein